MPEYKDGELAWESRKTVYSIYKHYTDDTPLNQVVLPKVLISYIQFVNLAQLQQDRHADNVQIYPSSSLSKQSISSVYLVDLSVARDENEAYMRHTSLKNMVLKILYSKYSQFPAVLVEFVISTQAISIAIETQVCFEAYSIWPFYTFFTLRGSMWTSIQTIRPDYFNEVNTSCPRHDDDSNQHHNQNKLCHVLWVVWHAWLASPCISNRVTGSVYVDQKISQHLDIYSFSSFLKL